MADGTAKVFRMLLAMKGKIDNFFGGQDWSTRKISRADKEGHPSLTLRTELERLGLKADEYVIVAFRKDDRGEYLEIRPFSQFIEE